MARNTSPKGLRPRADVRASRLEDAAWDHDHDEAARPSRAPAAVALESGFHRFRDGLGGVTADGSSGERWVRRLAVVIARVDGHLWRVCFGALWWRLGAGPINLEMATPWLAAAIEENIGHDNTVEVGGTQIERAGRIRIAVRIRDIIVRDRDHAIVASAPKAEVRAVRHGAADGTAARRKPQSGGCLRSRYASPRTATSRSPPATMRARSQPA